MKRNAPLSLHLLIPLALVLPTDVQACSCTAPDGSCSASVSCPGGCDAIFAEGGYCSAECVNEGGGPKPPPRPGPGSLSEAPEGKIRLSAARIPGSRLAQLLSETTRGRLAFLPTLPDQLISVELKDVPLDQLPEILSRVGSTAVRTEGATSPQAPEAESRISTQVESVRTGDVARLLAEASGGRVAFRPSDPDKRISLELRDFPMHSLKEILTPHGSVVMSSVSDP
jgi:hypothetical protein